MDVPPDGIVVFDLDVLPKASSVSIEVKHSRLGRFCNPSPLYFIDKDIKF